MTDSSFAFSQQKDKPNNLPTLHTVPFHGDCLATFEHDGERWVALRPIVEALEIDWGRQSQKLAADPRWNCRHMSTVGADGKQRDMLSIPLRRFPGWVATINPNKIPDQVKREKVILYQDRSYDALYDFWFKGAAFRDDMDGVVTDFDPRAMKALGGMVKGIVNKALTETVQEMVEKALASDPRVALREFRSALEALRDYGVPQKGRRGLVLKCSASLRNYCSEKDVVPRRCARTNTWLYPAETIAAWWRNTGSKLVHDFLVEKQGQNVFPFMASKKKGGAV